MSIIINVPCYVLVKAAQYIVYKKLLQRKIKMLDFAKQIMVEYNTKCNKKCKMEMKDAICIVYSSVKNYPNEEQWYEFLKNKYPQFYSDNFLYNMCLSIYTFLKDEDNDFKSRPTVRDVLNGTLFAHYYIDELYRIKFTNVETNIVSMRYGNKLLSDARIDSVTFSIIVKLLKEKQSMRK